uniref:Integrase core domain containing protein n=1 Tax=Solanum tuberosum TaxID=4113 RepID=M1DWQ1_SOLTU
MQVLYTSVEVEAIALQFEKGATPSGSESQSVSSTSISTTSSSEADNSGDSPVPTIVVLAPNANEPNKLCVPSQHQLYENGTMMNEHRRMVQTVTEERRVLTGSLRTITAIQELFLDAHMRVDGMEPWDLHRRDD